jgi:ABC-type transport system substrate-binding protein
MRVSLIIALWLGVCCQLRAWADVPLYEQNPYDQITLDENNGGAVLKVTPLKLPDRRLPGKPAADEKLVIQLVDQPDRKYELAWGAIKRVELFEHMLLVKANELLAANKLDDAYNYFRFLDENYPNMAGLAAANEEYLFKQAKAFYAKQQYRNALAVLRELHRRNPQRPKLDGAMAAMTEKLVDQYAADADYPPIRGLLRSLNACYPDHPLVEKWQSRLKSQAAAQLAAATAAEQSGDLRKASAALRQVIQLWPALQGAREAAEAMHKKYPRLVVGVCEAAPSLASGRAGNGEELLTDWASRRRDRLVCRTLTEYAGPRARGGRYVCPLGDLKIDETGRRITIELKPNLRWSAGQSRLTGYDVSRRLMAMADPASGDYRPDWATIFDGVSVRSVYQVNIDLLHGHACPQAFLQTALLPYTDSGAPQSERLPLGGPYIFADEIGPDTTYLLNANYFALAAGQPKEIVERRFPNGAAAAGALRRGEIQVWDRLNPWQVKSLSGNENLTVQPYALPRLHCLIPNARKPLLASRTFRRALAYGIDCQAILNQILQGDPLPGCALIHGPFPVGVSEQGPLDYASDPELAPWPFEPRQAMGLAEVGRREWASRFHVEGATAPLVLAYPPDEVARTACTAIQQQLAAVGINVTLKELPAIDTGAMPEDVDLLYAEVAMWEPLVDASRLLGESGLPGGCSSQMSDALRRLGQATDWNDVVALLHRIDRIAHDEVAIVPLWQLNDYFAYRKDLQGVAAKTLSLYQDIEQWKLGFQYPSED